MLPTRLACLLATSMALCAPATARGEAGKVFVHIQTHDGEVVLSRARADGGWQTLCEAPCDEWIDRAGSFRLTSDQGPHQWSSPRPGKNQPPQSWYPTRTFTLDVAGEGANLRAEMHSSYRLYSGLGLLPIGVGFGVVGGAVLAGPAATADARKFKIGVGAATLVVGAALAALAVYCFSTLQSDVDVSPAHAVPQPPVTLALDGLHF